jgi:hypothetical protein
VLTLGVYALVGMLCGKTKRLPGSYCPFTATSRERFAP